MTAATAGGVAAKEARRRLRPASTLSSWTPSLVGVCGLVAIWELVGLTVFHESKTIPPPSGIVSQMLRSGWHFYWPNIHTTVREAATGWVWGNAVAIVLAICFVEIPLLEKALMQVAVAVYSLPIVAIGPVLAILYRGDAPKVILAALAVFFSTLVAAVLGLRSADRTSLELVKAYGGGSWTQLWRVRLRASLPSLFAGLRMAAPAAVLGAIIGEWLGAERGLGVAMIVAQQQLHVEQTWGIALAATLLSGVGYAATAAVGRLLTPWAPRVSR